MKKLLMIACMFSAHLVGMENPMERAVDILKSIDLGSKESKNKPGLSHEMPACAGMTSENKSNRPNEIMSMQELNAMTSEMMSNMFVQIFKQQSKNKGDASTPLHKAATAGHLGLVELLLAQPNVEVDLLDQEGETAFTKTMAGDKKEHVIIARLLLEKGANPNGAGIPFRNVRKPDSN